MKTKPIITTRKITITRILHILKITWEVPKAVIRSASHSNATRIVFKKIKMMS